MQNCFLQGVNATNEYVQHEGHVRTPLWFAILMILDEEESFTITCLGPSGHPEHDGTK